jgi:hypothetical protein
MPQRGGSGGDWGGGERKKAAWMSAAAPLCGEEMRVEAKAVLAHASGLLGGSEEEFTRAV